MKKVKTFTDIILSFSARPLCTCWLTSRTWFWSRLLFLCGAVMAECTRFSLSNGSGPTHSQLTNKLLGMLTNKHS